MRRCRPVRQLEHCRPRRLKESSELLSSRGKQGKSRMMTIHLYVIHIEPKNICIHISWYIRVYIPRTKGKKEPRCLPHLFQSMHFNLYGTGFLVKKEQQLFPSMFSLLLDLYPRTQQILVDALAPLSFFHFLSFWIIFSFVWHVLLMPLGGLICCYLLRYIWMR